MSFVLLGLLGTLVAGSFALDWSNDDDADQNEDIPPEETPEPNPEEAEEPTPVEPAAPNPDETGRELSFDGSDLIEGTEGDDTLIGAQDILLTPDAINLLGGNDTATIEVLNPITISGGDGDDAITATGVLNTVLGGAGNDTLTGDDSNDLFGGEGDDQLDFNHGSYDQGEWGVAYGGEGDDTITVRTDALVPEEINGDVGGVWINGGPGADDINIIYELTDSFDGGGGVIIGTGGDSNLAGEFIRLDEFDPSEDTLVVELERDEATAETDVTVELDQTEEDGTYTSLITLTFEATNVTSEATNVLTIYSAVPFTLDDIQLVGI